MGGATQKCNSCLAGEYLASVRRSVLARRDDGQTNGPTMRALTLMIASLAAPAIADCPTRADMATGVMLRDAGGDTKYDSPGVLDVMTNRVDGLRGTLELGESGE